MLSMKVLGLIGRYVGKALGEYLPNSDYYPCMGKYHR